MRPTMFFCVLICTAACGGQEASDGAADDAPMEHVDDGTKQTDAKNHDAVPLEEEDNSDAMAIDGPGDRPDAIAFTMERCGEQALTEDWVIAAGESANVCAGSVFTVSPGIRVLVEGQLHIAASAEKPVIFRGEEATAGSWGGIVVAAGGFADLDYVTLSDTTRVFEAQPDSDYVLDHIEASNSIDLVLLQASGLVDHGVFHALGGDQENQGPFMIEDASPLVRNSFFDHSNAVTDMIRVFGTSSSPEFDHLHVREAHCAFHIQQGTGVKIANSIIENVAYGIMAITSVDTQIEGNEFNSTSIHVGLCYGGAMNAPILDKNYYGEGEPVVDRSCEQVGVTPHTIMDEPPMGVGPAS